MTIPTPATRWTQSLDLPSRVLGRGSEDYELYEEDGEFVLRVEMPGFEVEEIDLNWHDNRLSISAEHESEARNRKKTYRRTFRFPKEVRETDIDATYENGVLEVRLPIKDGSMERGHSIEIKG